MLSENNPLVSDRQQQGVGGGRFFTDWTPVSCQGGYTLVAGYLDLGLASSPDIDHKRMWRCFVDAHRGQTCLNLMTSPTSAKPRLHTCLGAEHSECQPPCLCPPGSGEGSVLRPCAPSSHWLNSLPRPETTSGSPVPLGGFLALKPICVRTRSTFCVSAGPGRGGGG